MKFPIYQQLESNDCGATCIRMICSFYGKNFSLNQIKAKCEITKLGTTVTDLLNCCTYFGIDSLPIKCEVENVREIILPVILHWKRNHFVVLYNVKKRGGKAYYYIADPSFGKVVLDEQEFLQQWLRGNSTGIAILCQPNDNFGNVYIERDNSTSKITIKKFLLKYKRHLNKMVGSTVLLILSIVINWMFPMLFQKLVDLGIGMKDLSIIWKYIFIQTVFVAGYIISSNVSSIILMKINFEVSINYLSEYILKIIRLPIKFFDSKIKSEFIQRIDDQSRLQSFLSFKVISFIISFLSFIVFSSLLLYYSAKIFLVFIVLSIVSFGWTVSFLKKRLYLDYNRFAAQAENRNNIQDILDGMSDIKINNAQQCRLDIWESTQNRINTISLKAIILNYYQSVGSSFFDRMRDILIIFICSILIIKEQSTLGTLLTISYILGQLTYSLSQIYQFCKDFQDANISLNRLSDIQNKEDENINGKLSVDIVKSIQFKSVSFKYLNSSNVFVINGLSLDVPINKTTAVVGMSGSGKTTLIKLLLGFYTPQEGSIYVNDEKLESIVIDKWRDKCGAVLQDGYIFSGSVSENIALGSHNYDIEKVRYAAQIACADEFIDLLPNKYDTTIGNSGLQLSGGQKQRLLIARAIYKDPDIFIFDEATSHLDTENERQIVINLQKHLSGKTIIIIAHRLSTVVNADKIIYLDKGKIVEEGNHSTLSEKKGLYYNLIKNQLQTN